MLRNSVVESPVHGRNGSQIARGHTPRANRFSVRAWSAFARYLQCKATANRRCNRAVAQRFENAAQWRV
eukprot:635883-Lingulodinium_polyedra.AAC.1